MSVKTQSTGASYDIPRFLDKSKIRKIIYLEWTVPVVLHLFTLVKYHTGTVKFTYNVPSGVQIDRFPGVRKYDKSMPEHNFSA